jgi:uncharacterized protein (DUF169 family)
MDPEKVDARLRFYLRSQSFPVAVRMLRPGEPVPAEARRPGRDFKEKFTHCQVINMARRWGWTLALTGEDASCPLGITAFGFEKLTHLSTSGVLCAGLYTATADAGVHSEAAVDRFPVGEYCALLVAPLDRCTFEPDLVVLYASPAQVMRLVQAALWKRGGKLTSSFGCRIDCSETVVTPIRTGECQVVLPGAGDRVFGQTQDHEMAFSIPWARMEEVLEGLEGTHQAGIRYPIAPVSISGLKSPPPD